MDLLGIAAIIAACTGFGGMLFAGYVAIRQLPAIHTLVNSRAARQDAKIEELTRLIAVRDAAALEKSDTALEKAEATVAAMTTPPGEHS